MKIPSPNLFCSLQGSPYKGPHTDFLQSRTLGGAGMRRKQSFLLRTFF